MIRRGALLRFALFAAGVALIVWLVRDAGTARVLEAIDHAGRWMPVVALLEALILATDLWASRALLGSAPNVEASTWARATLFAYAASVLLPAGRAAGEATRAATLAPEVGVARASGTCSRLQAAVLAGNAITCAAIALLVPHEGQSRVLSLALAANALLCSVAAGVLVLLARSTVVRAWLRARFPRFTDARAPRDAAPVRRPVGVAILPVLLGRAIQAVQYGVLVHAVGGTATPMAALTAQGVHLVGATLGDVVPNQMGVTEGAYRVFAPALHMEAAPVRALSIALVIRLAQLGVAAACLIATLFVARQPRAAETR